MKKEYKIFLRLDNYETPVITIEAKNWKALCDYIFGKIEIIDTESLNKRRR